MKAYKRVKTIISMIVLVIVVLAGCAPEDADVSENVETGFDYGKLIKVGFSQLGAESDWRIANTESIRTTLTREAGYQLIYEDAQQKQANQTMSIRRFIQQGVDYIVVAPATETGWDNVLVEAKNAGIPVIIIDRQIKVSDPFLYVCHIGSNFRLEADKVTAWLEQYIRINEINNKRVRIVDLQGTEGATAQIGRSNGLMSAVKRNGWKLVASVSGDFTQAKGREVMTRILNEYPKVNVVYSENDNMSLGAIEAIEAAGRKVGGDIENGEIMILSFDGVNREALELLKKGSIACIGECYPMHGPYVRAVIEMLESGGTPDKETYVSEGLRSANTDIIQVSVGMDDYPVTIMK